MIDIINYDGQEVPEYISKGNHAKYIIPLAQEVCKGRGLDIGCGKLEWSFPGSVPVDPKIDPTYDAFNLPSNLENPNGQWDYIFSSHCLEHIPDYVEALRLWTNKLKIGGVLFLYLPDYTCKHWRPYVKMNSAKHYHQFFPFQIVDMMDHMGYDNIFSSERDLAYSFAVMGEKACFLT